MFDEKILKLSKILSDLKDKLKCTICLDVIQETAELECGHKFCTECYLNYKSNQKQTCCPLCKAVVGRRSVIYKDDFADKLGSYVSRLSDTFKKSYGYDVERIVQCKYVIPARIKTKKAMNSKRDDVKPSTSKIRPNPVRISSSQDAFDVLLNKSSPDNLFVNKKGTKRIYHNKKKDKEEESHLAYKILDFGDNENKSAVLRWLNDTRNRFERLTQTQSLEVESNDYISNTDLVSVSQIRQNESVPQLKSTVRYRPRARSLDVEIKKRNKERKTLLEGSNVDVKENYTIEDTDTEEEEIVKKAEENILLNIIEDQYLDKLEGELKIKKNQETTYKSPKEPQDSQPSTSGWGRIGKISKTLSKKGKAPKKLNITVKSSQTSNINTEKKDKKYSSKRNSKNEGKAELPQAAKKQSPLQPVNVRNNQTPEKENVKTCGDLVFSSTPRVKAKHILAAGSTNENTKFYDLDAVETYISENMEVIEKEDSSNANDLSDLRNDELEMDNYSNKENNENFINIAPEKEKVIVLDLVVLGNNDLDEPLNKELEDPYLLPTQKLNTSIYSKFNESNKDRLCDNNPFLILTQKITANKQTEDVFLEPTEEPTRKYKNNLSTEIGDCADCVEEQDESIDNLFSTLQNALRYCQDSVNIKTVKDKLNIINSCVTRLRKLIVDKTTSNTPVAVENIPPKELCDTVTQTSFSVQTKQVQTETCESINREVQTEDCVVGKLDMDDSRHSKCITQNTEKALQSIISESAVNFENMSPVKQDKQTIANSATQNNYFSATLDNFCFDTQDITKGSAKLGLSNEAQAVVPQKRDEKEFLSMSDGVNREDAAKSQKSTKSVLMCSLSSDTSKKVNRKLTYHDSVGTKRSLSDSDDEVIMPKKLCNRFIRDDLSIEFDINTETEGITQSKKNYSRVLLPDSDSVDYDDYLDKVMKKYDDNDCLISTPEKDSDCRGDEEVHSSVRKDDIETKADKMMDCEKIIAQVGKNIQKLSKHNDTKSSYKTATQSSEKSCRDDDLGLMEVIEMKDGEDLRGQTESSDIIGETESLEPLPKRARTTNLNVGFDQGEFTNTALDQSINLLDIAKSNNEQDKVCHELDDSLDDAEFANIKITEEKRSDDNSSQQADGIQFTPEVNEDLFSDDDIVETTPRKEKSFIEIRSQRGNPCNLSFPLPKSEEAIENFNLDFTPLPPPPDFQDTPLETDKDDTYTSHHVTVIEFDQTLKDTAQSLTPDVLAQHENIDIKAGSNVKSDAFRKDGFHASTPQKLPSLDISKKRISSTQLTQSSDSSCNLSPITGVKSLIEQAQSSTHTPLSISKQSTRKQTILTSTPRQKSIWNYITSQSSDCGIVKSKPCIACTRLSKDKTQSISLLTNRKLATYSQVFDKSVTHIIVTVTEKNWIKDYTMKFVAGVAAGIWILNFDWVQECLCSNSIVPEEPYEVLDDIGLPGPKTARLTRKENPLLKGFKFYCANSLFSTTIGDVEDVIKMLGGQFVSTLDKLSEKDGKVGLIITEGRSTQDFEVYETWLDLYKTATVDIEWLSKSVGRYKLLSIRPYIWCSDDNLDDLGYPPHLTEMVQSSSEQY